MLGESAAGDLCSVQVIGTPRQVTALLAENATEMRNVIADEL